MKKPSVALIGAGAAGSAMVVALHRAGYPITAVASRRLESAQRCAALVNCQHAGIDETMACSLAEIIILATPDAVIENCCQSLADAGAFTAGQLLLHLSGALTSDVLETARSSAVDTLSLHPAQTLVEPLHGADLLRTAWFCLEGDDAAVKRGSQLANDLSGNSFVISKDKKMLYHAALSLSCNYLTTLEAIAVNLLAEAGISRKDALCLLLPLIQGSVDTLSKTGLPAALTGPISRGDTDTIKEHLNALQTGPESYLQLYKLMGLEALKIARAKDKMREGSADAIENCLSRD